MEKTNKARRLINPETKRFLSELDQKTILRNLMYIDGIMINQLNGD